jgi:hypothetical protein
MLELITSINYVGLILEGKTRMGLIGGMGGMGGMDQMK